ncbi:MAG: addiction module protein [Flavobacteriaceae bacterium]|jgi:6-pyruvoyl-tetrahydropterin synthase|nr:addiction module protein [Flavobacteriaceae bacterium]
MDTATDLKKRIHEFIDHADDRILNIFNEIIATEEIEEEIENFDIPDWHKKILDERMESHFNNPEKTKNFDDLLKSKKERWTKT